MYKVRYRATTSSPPYSRSNISQLQYATHFLAIASMTCSKMSIILMFRRIDPAQASPIARILMPGCGLYTVVCLFLAAFQCQMPTPWILQPSTCWSKGQVHYVTSGLNIATDAVLAFWMIPIIWSLQMARGTRAVVISLVASRVIVCILDGTKVVFITKALNSGDYTCQSSLTHFALHSLTRIHRVLTWLGRHRPDSRAPLTKPCYTPTSTNLSPQPPKRHHRSTHTHHC